MSNSENCFFKKWLKDIENLLFRIKGAQIIIYENDEAISNLFVTCYFAFLKCEENYGTLYETFKHFKKLVENRGKQKKFLFPKNDDYSFEDADNYNNLFNKVDSLFNEYKGTEIGDVNIRDLKRKLNEYEDMYQNFHVQAVNIFKSVLNRFLQDELLLQLHSNASSIRKDFLNKLSFPDYSYFTYVKNSVSTFFNCLDELNKCKKKLNECQKFINMHFNPRKSLNEAQSLIKIFEEAFLEFKDHNHQFEKLKKKLSYWSDQLNNEFERLKYGFISIKEFQAHIVTLPISSIHTFCVLRIKDYKDVDKVLIIDTGKKHRGVAEFLKEKGILKKKEDEHVEVYHTHMHEDHTGNTAGIKSLYNNSEDCEEFRLIQRCSEDWHFKGFEERELFDCEGYSVHTKVDMSSRITLFVPPYNQDENKSSFAVQVEFLQEGEVRRILFTGDMEMKRIMENFCPGGYFQPVNIMVAPHHGSEDNIISTYAIERNLMIVTSGIHSKRNMINSLPKNLNELLSSSQVKHQDVYWFNAPELIGINAKSTLHTLFKAYGIDDEKVADFKHFEENTNGCIEDVNDGKVTIILKKEDNVVKCRIHSKPKEITATKFDHFVQKRTASSSPNIYDPLPTKNQATQKLLDITNLQSF
ncbi:hypothetical protein PCE1_002513 [Barthelona sp. PCE]